MADSAETAIYISLMPAEGKRCLPRQRRLPKAGSFLEGGYELQAKACPLE